MGTRIETKYDIWKRYNTTAEEYVIGRSCTYDGIFSRLTLRIFVHQFKEANELRIGEISIFVERDEWKRKANLDSPVKADTQLKEAALSAQQGNWKLEALTRMLKQGFEEIKNQIAKYEQEGVRIAGEFALQ